MGVFEIMLVMWFTFFNSLSLIFDFIVINEMWLNAWLLFVCFSIALPVIHHQYFTWLYTMYYTVNLTRHDSMGKIPSFEFHLSYFPQISINSSISLHNTFLCLNSSLTMSKNLILFWRKSQHILNQWNTTQTILICQPSCIIHHDYTNEIPSELIFPTHRNFLMSFRSKELLAWSLTWLITNLIVEIVTM